MSARRFVVAALAAGLIAALVATLSDSSPSRNAAAVVTAGQPGPLDPLSCLLYTSPSPRDRS